MFVRAYLRASTKEQDAGRAKQELATFAKERGLKIAAYYVENVSGASLARPELVRLLSDCEEGDILLVEQVDRLSRLNAADWDHLKGEIKRRRIKVVALDLQTSWQMANTDPDDFTVRMFESLNGMLLDMLAAIARKDYEDRRKRQAQGIKKAKEQDEKRDKEERVYRGRRENKERNTAILKMLKGGQSWSSIVAATGASRSTLARLAKRGRAGA